MPEKRKLKTKLHFNRINMQRGDPRVWSAHTSKACHGTEKIVIVRDGEVLLETVFNPGGSQPRAYLQMQGCVWQRDGITFIEI